MSNPPIAHKKPVTVEKFGDTRVDDYFWLREKSSPEVIDYLNAENAHTQTALAPLKDLKEKLYQDMLSRIQETDENVPYRQGDYWYYSRTEAGKQYSIYCRKHGSPGGRDVLDPADGKNDPDRGITECQSER